MNYFWAALLLSVERFAYAYLWQYPTNFANFARLFGYEKPTEFIYLLTFLFKFINVYVFVTWFLEEMDDFNYDQITAAQVGMASILFVIGQGLNILSWRCLGKAGICYGDRFGMDLPWCTSFPYNIVPHPQYVGGICTFWALFIPFWQIPSWYKLPFLESVLYINSAYLWEHD